MSHPRVSGQLLTPCRAEESKGMELPPPASSQPRGGLGTGWPLAAGSPQGHCVHGFLKACEAEPKPCELNGTSKEEREQAFKSVSNKESRVIPSASVRILKPWLHPTACTGASRSPVHSWSHLLVSTCYLSRTCMGIVPPTLSSRHPWAANGIWIPILREP